MKVEILKEFKHNDQITGEFINAVVGDQRTFRDDLGAYFCKMGWVKDLSGTIPTGKPNLNEVVLAPDDTINGISVESV